MAQVKECIQKAYEVQNIIQFQLIPCYKVKLLLCI